MSSSMSSSVVVKSSLGDDVRRFTLNQPFAYAQLISLLCGAYPNISSFSIKYRDEENDLVSITNDSELLDAIVASNKILRISVFSSSENGGKELNALGSTNASASASDGKSTESSDNNNNNNNNSHDAVTKKASSTSDGVEGGGVSSKKKRKEEKKKHRKQTIELSSSSSSSDSEEDAAVKTVVVKEKAPVDVHCPLGTSVHVYHEGDDVWDATLNQTSIGQNSNKFYVIQLLESDNARQYWCWYRWGRVGAAGQNALIACGPSLDRAKQEFQQKFLDKTKNAWANRKNFETFRGKYTLLEMDYGGVNKEQEKASSSVSSSSSSSSSSSVVSVPTPIPAPVKESSSSSSSFSSSSDSDVELNVPTNDTITIHTNIICNMCNMNPIIGIRYKCSVCEDFDLCSNCEALNAHPPNHALIKLRSSSSSSSILKKRYARMIIGHSHPHSHSHHHHHHHPHPFHRVGGCLAKHWQHQADKQRQRDEEEEKAIQKRKEEKIAEKLARKAEKERLKQEKKQAREEKKQMKEKKKREEEEEEEEEGHLKFVFSAPPPKASAPASPAPIDTATAAPAPAVVSETVIADSAPIAAVASPSVPPPPPSYRAHKYETQLQALSSMGFSNRELNIYMLEKSNGNLQECANWLLEHLM